VEFTADEEARREEDAAMESGGKLETGLATIAFTFSSSPDVPGEGSTIVPWTRQRD